MALDAERKELLLAIEENQILNDWFNHPGFKVFSEKVKDNLELAKDLQTVPDERELYRRKGQIDILQWFLTFHSQVRSTLEYQIREAEMFVRQHNNG